MPVPSSFASTQLCASVLIAFAAASLTSAQTYTFGQGILAAGTQPVSIATADFDGDGSLDLVVANRSDNMVSVYLSRNDGTFRSPVNYPTGPQPSSVAVGDFNGDGNLDLVVTNENCVILAHISTLQCSSASSILSRRPQLSKKCPSLRTSLFSLIRSSSSRSRSRANGLSSGPPPVPTTGKNAAPFKSVPAPAKSSVISLHSTSSPTTLRYVEHSGVTLALEIFTRTINAVNAPVSMNSFTIQRSKSHAGALRSEVDTRCLRQIMFKQNPENIGMSFAVPFFKFIEFAGNIRGRAFLGISRR